jgi:hypothetical protein
MPLLYRVTIYFAAGVAAAFQKDKLPRGRFI